MLAGKVFNHTAAYDAMIANYFNEINEVEVPEKLTVTYDLKQTLRYGENPHQKAAFYQTLTTDHHRVLYRVNNYMGKNYLTTTFRCKRGY